MSSREQYAPGAASGAEVRKDGEKWTLVLVRDLPHPPAKVWKALTDPEHLREWAPFDSDRNLGTVGTAKLSTVGAPTPHVSETQVKRADAPKVLEFSWGEQDIRWELEPLAGGGTRLTLWHNIDRRFISMGAAGWHICFDVLERLLAGQPIGRIVGAEAMKFGGWQRLNAEYAKQFGVETPGRPSRPGPRAQRPPLGGGWPGGGGLGRGHRRALGALVLLLAPPAGHAGFSRGAANNMKKSATTKGESPSRLIDARIKELDDWRGK